MIYTVPTTKAKEFLKSNTYVSCTDEAEAVSMAAGEYMATGIMPTVCIGENGTLNALDAIVTLIQLYEIPLNLMIFMRTDEIQHSIVAKQIKKVLALYEINAQII